MRRIHLIVLLLGILLLTPGILWSQRGPGGGGGGGGKKGGGGGGFGGMGGGGMPQMDPNKIFDMFAKGQDSVPISSLPEMMQGRIKDALPAGTEVLTREDFKGLMEKAAAGGGMRGTGQGGGGNPGDPSQQGGRQGGGRRQGPNGSPDQAAEGLFKRYDKDNDGVLSYEEMPEELKNERTKWDKNGDGFIDQEEFKSYYIARVATKDGNAPGGDKNGSQSANQSQTPIEDNPRPTIIRAGKLPKDLPDWFIELDKAGDNDGQVGLYEWNTKGWPINQFEEMDLNHDGLLTAEEYFKWKKMADEKKQKDPSLAAALGPDGEVISDGEGDDSGRQRTGFGQGGPGGPGGGRMNRNGAPGGGDTAGPGGSGRKRDGNGATPPGGDTGRGRGGPGAGGDQSGDQVRRRDRGASAGGSGGGGGGNSGGGGRRGPQQ